MTRRPRAVSADEADLFHDALRDAKPLTGRTRRAPHPKTEPKAQAAPAASHSARAQPPLPPRTAPLPPLAHGPAPGVDKRTQERFRKGEMAIDAHLDLHGMTQDAAHGALLRFVHRSVDAGHRCLLIVTGKGAREGTGVLRAQVPRWLNEAGLRPHLLAMHRARPQHGGEGALYVLLKRKR